MIDAARAAGNFTHGCLISGARANLGSGRGESSACTGMDAYCVFPPEETLPLLLFISIGSRGSGGAYAAAPYKAATLPYDSPLI